MNILILVTVVVLTVVALGGAGFAFAGAGSDRARARVAAIGKAKTAAVTTKSAAEDIMSRRKSVQVVLKELELRQSQEKNKQRPSLRRRIEQAGLSITPRSYWIYSGIAGMVAAVLAFLAVPWIIAAVLAGFAFALGAPRWVLVFLKARRQKAFTREFASAVEAIVRSVKTGLPVHEALRLVGSEIPEPVGGEFRLLTDSLKLGITMEDGIKRMFDRMPTAEVNFFGIVMSIQTKSGGNLSEALSNLAGVLRDRKRLVNKIRALSSEAKAGAIIIGSMPPGVMIMVYITTPDYMKVLLLTDIGNLLLMGCAVWMVLGILVMKKMIAIKY
jgi:tight adherence protein B